MTKNRPLNEMLKSGKERNTTKCLGGLINSKKICICGNNCKFELLTMINTTDRLKGLKKQIQTYIINNILNAKDITKARILSNAYTKEELIKFSKCTTLPEELKGYNHQHIKLAILNSKVKMETERNAGEFERLKALITT